MATDVIDLGNTESAGGLSGLTKKQKEMSYARSPMNNQELNLSSMEEKEGILSAPEAVKQQQEKQGVGAFAAGKRESIAANNPQIAGLKATLGTFATRLEGAINQYLQGGATSTINASLASGGQPVYDPLTKTWKLPEVTMQQNLTGVLGEKLQQKEQIEQTYAPFRDKRFEEVLDRFADVNGDGVLDDQEKQFLSTSFGIVNALRRLEQLDPYSPEAEALKMQLQMQDREGLVSGLQSAMERYESISGLKVSGPEGEDKTLKDIVNMTSEQVLAELKKATEGAEGLFSGEAATSLKRGFDEASRQYTRAGQEDVLVRNELKDAAADWIAEYEDTLESARSAINEQFLGAASGIIQDLEAEKAALAAKGEDVKWIDQAKKWFVDLSEGVKSGTRNFAAVIQELLSSDVGMAPEARKALKTWLGKTIGEDAQAQGELAKMLNDIATTGTLVVKDEVGNSKRVMFTSADRQRVAQILADESLSATEKNEAIQGVIAERSGQVGVDLKKDAEYVAGLATDGNFQSSLKTFRDSMVTSLKSFKSAAVRDVYNKIIAAGVDPATLGPDAMKGVIEQRSTDMQKAIQDAAGLAKKQVQDIIDAANTDVTELTTLQGKFGDLRTQGVAAVKQAIENVISQSVTKYAPAILAAYKNAGREPPPANILNEQAHTYAFLSYLRGAQGTSLYAAMREMWPQLDNYIARPGVAFGMTPDDANIASHIRRNVIPSMDGVYANLFAGSEAARHLDKQAGEIEKRLTLAKDTSTKANTLLKSIGTTEEKALADVTGLTNVSPLQMFFAAKTGNTTLLSQKYNNYTPEDFVKMGLEIGYTADGTTEIAPMPAYDAPEVKEMTAIEGISKLVTPPPSVVPVPQDVANRVKNDDMRIRKGSSVRTYTLPSRYGSGNYTITLPEGVNINTYIAESGLLEYVDPERISSKGGEAYGVGDLLRDLTPNSVLEFLGISTKRPESLNPYAPSIPTPPVPAKTDKPDKDKEPSRPEPVGDMTGERRGSGGRLVDKTN